MAAMVQVPAFVSRAGHPVVRAGRDVLPRAEGGSDTVETQELERLRFSIYERLRWAIQEGDKERALALLDEIDRHRAAYRNVYLTWIDLLLTYIADRLGEEAVYETMRVFDRRMVRPTIEGTYGDAGAEDRLKRRANLWTCLHGATLDSISEDDEKFVLSFRCASGGSIRTKEQFGKTRGAYPWTYGQSGFSYYCIHCPTSFDIMSIEQLGYPVWVTFPQPEGRCVQWLYKDPRAVPDQYYRRVGKERKAVE